MGLTSTLHLELIFPSIVLAITSVVPSAIALIIPFLTIATFLFVDSHSISLFVAFCGVIIAIIVSSCPMSIFNSCLFNSIASIFIGLVVINEWPIKSDPLSLHCIFVSPNPTAVTNPSLTVATSSFMENHSTSLSVVLSGFIV